MGEVFSIQGIVDIVTDQAMVRLAAVEKAGKDTAQNLNQSFLKASQAVQHLAGPFKQGGDAAAATGQKVVQTFNQVDKAATRTASNIDTSFKKVSQTMDGLAANQLAHMLGNLTNQFVSASSEMEGYRLTWIALEKDVGKAEQRIQKIVQFAKTTPFDLPQVNEAAIKLRALGQNVDALLTPVGNLAALMKRDYVQAAEAVGKAMNGIPEGLEQLRNSFGISVDQMKKYGIQFDSNNQIMIKGSQGIAQFRRNLGDLLQNEFGGIMDARSQGLEGHLSNMYDSLHQAAAAIGDTLSPAIKVGADWVGYFADKLAATSPEIKFIIGAVAGIAAGLTALAAAAAPVVYTIGALSTALGALTATQAVSAGAIEAETVAMGAAASATGEASLAVEVLGATMATTMGVFALMTLAIVAAANAFEKLAAENQASARSYKLMADNAKEAAPAIKAVQDARGKPVNEQPGALPTNQAATAVQGTIQNALQDGDVKGALDQFKTLQEAAKQAQEKLNTGKLTPQEGKQAAQTLSSFAETGQQLLDLLGQQATPTVHMTGRGMVQAPGSPTAIAQLAGLRKTLDGGQLDIARAQGKSLYGIYGKQQTDASTEYHSSFEEHATLADLQKSQAATEHLQKVRGQTAVGPGLIPSQDDQDQAKLALDAMVALRAKAIRTGNTEDEAGKAFLDKLDEDIFNRQKERREKTRTDTLADLSYSRDIHKAQNDWTIQDEGRVLEKMLATPNLTKEQYRQYTVEFKQLQEQVLESNRRTSIEILNLQGKETDAKLAALALEVKEWRKAGVDETYITQQEALKREQIYAEETKKKQAILAQAQANIAGRQAVTITGLEARRARGENVDAQLTTAIQAESGAKVKEIQDKLAGDLAGVFGDTKEAKDTRQNLRDQAAVATSQAQQDAELKVADIGRNRAKEEKQQAVEANELEQKKLDFKLQLLDKQEQQGKPVEYAILEATRQQTQLVMDQLRLKADMDIMDKSAVDQARIKAQLELDLNMARQKGLDTEKAALKTYEDQKAAREGLKDPDRNDSGFAFTMGGISSDPNAHDAGGKADDYKSWKARRAAATSAERNAALESVSWNEKERDRIAKRQLDAGDFQPIGMGVGKQLWGDVKAPGPTTDAQQVPVPVDMKITLIGPDKKEQTFSMRSSSGNGGQQQLNALQATSNLGGA